jgi:hypothetical protein
MDRFELKLGLSKQALELLGPELIEPLVVVIEDDQAAKPAIDALGRPDRPGRVMAARVRRTIAAL